MRVGRSIAVAAIAAIALAGLASPALAQEEAPKTGWGAPDLQGVWDFRTITPLQRPEDLGDKAFLTEEEAVAREQAAVQRDIDAWNADARAHRGRRQRGRLQQLLDGPGHQRHRHPAHVAHHRPAERPDAGVDRRGAGARRGRPRLVQRHAPRFLYRPEQRRPLPDGLQRRPPDHPGRLQPERPDLPDPRPPRDDDRDGAHRAQHPHRRPRRDHRRAPRPVVGQLGRALGGRHPGRRDHQLRHRPQLAGLEHHDAPGRSGSPASTPTPSSTSTPWTTRTPGPSRGR